LLLSEMARLTQAHLRHGLFVDFSCSDLFYFRIVADLSIVVHLKLLIK